MFILASNSPRRKELLALVERQFMVLAAQIDESVLPGESIEAYVRRASQLKAYASLQLIYDQDLLADFIIACDTAVVDENTILGKPIDEEDAARMLQRLRARKHNVYSALSIIDGRNGSFHQELCITEVTMRAYSDQEVDKYIASGDPLDKAGAYAVQHAGFHPVVDMQGCYANVMGLPLCHLARTLMRLEPDFNVDVPRKCQNYLNYDCLVFQGIIGGEL